MKILFVSHSCPIPCDSSGRAHTLNMIRELARWGHEIHVAVLNSGASVTDRFAQLESELAGGQAYEIEMRAPHELASIEARAWRMFLRGVRHEAGFRFPLDYHFDDRAIHQLRALHEVAHFGAVIVETVSLSKAFEAFDSKVFRILDTHEIFGDRHKRLRRAGRKPGWYATTPREEDAGLRRADLILAIHRGEERRLRRRLKNDGDRVRTVSHFLDLSRRIEPKGITAAAFVGSMSESNIVGFDFLARKVLPRVLEHHPNFELLIAGPISERVRRQRAVRGCGFVENIADLYARAPLALHPVTVSPGFSIRVPEAMACGVPGVGTQAAVHGLDPRLLGGVTIVKDGDAEAFAAAILEILDDSTKSRRMGADAYSAAGAWNQQQRSSLREVLEIASLFHVGAYRRTSATPTNSKAGRSIAGSPGR